MDRITSFQVDHLRLGKGIYVSKKEDDILTLDLRMRRPYKDEVLSGVQMHSLEHLLATALRSGRLKNNVVYVGPMGCATGFYVLYRGVMPNDALGDIIDGLKAAIATDAMPGSSMVECGNYYTLDLEIGKALIREYLDVVGGNSDMDKYPMPNDC